MTVQHDYSEADAVEARDASAVVKLPLVSVIIVNYNYSQFLKAVVESTFTQTYTNIECILVDNASTDATPSVLASLAATYPDLKIIRRAENGGQTAASLDGFAESRGHYIIFIDADDILLPRSVETHVFAHLSSRVHIGFTAGDMLQMVDDSIVVSGGEALSSYVRGRTGGQAKRILPYAHPFAPAWPEPVWAATIASRLHYVPPLTNRWVWSPTSGNCFRRDAVLMFSDYPMLPTLRSGTDMYLAHGIGGLCGSLLIDEPVFAYRIHTSNIFTTRPQLNRTLSYQPGGGGDSNDRARLMLVDHLVWAAARFVPNTVLKLNYVALLFRLDYRDIDTTLPMWRRRSRVAGRLVDHAAEVRAALGPALTTALMLAFRVPWRRIRCAAPTD